MKAKMNEQMARKSKQYEQMSGEMCALRKRKALAMVFIFVLLSLCTLTAFVLFQVAVTPHQVVISNQGSRCWIEQVFSPEYTPCCNENMSC